LQIYFSRALPTRYVPPSGFGYPLGGFLPAIPCRFYFTPTALMGFTLRSFPPLERYPARYHPDAPTYRFARCCSSHRSGRPATTSRGSWALTLPRVPDERHGFSASPAGCSPGFPPSRAFPRKPWPGLHPASSHALPTSDGKTARRAGAPEYHSAFASPHHRPHRIPAGRQGNPSRISAPARSRIFRCGFVRAMCSPHTASCITADRPAILGRS
jgi:hypothetical protein